MERNALLSYPWRPPLKACEGKKARQPGHQSGPQAEEAPCLVLDSSKEGFRLRGSFDLRRGQVVELILDEETVSPERCSVVWVGKAGSKQEGEVGLETV
jgi:hypothetical protein